MKDKLLQMRVDEEFLSKLDYLKEINGYKTNAETIRKTVEKEFRKETIMNNLEIMECDYLREIEEKGCEDGYLKMDRMFIEIGKNKNHELSLDSALEFVDFYGYQELVNWSGGKRGFVARSAFDCIGKAIENGLLVKRE